MSALSNDMKLNLDIDEKRISIVVSLSSTNCMAIDLWELNKTVLSCSNVLAIATVDLLLKYPRESFLHGTLCMFGKSCNPLN